MPSTQSTLPPVGAVHGWHIPPQLSGDALLTHASAQRCWPDGQAQTRSVHLAPLGQSSVTQQLDTGMHTPSHGLLFAGHFTDCVAELPAADSPAPPRPAGFSPRPAPASPPLPAFAE